MTPESFTYWLQGFVELNGGAMPTELQWKMIQDHLSLVFNKVTPTYPELTPYTPSIPSPWQGPYEITCGSKPQPTEPMRYCAQLELPYLTGIEDIPSSMGIGYKVGETPPSC